MLYECAAQGTRVSSELVLYSGWKSYGRFLQTEPFGSYWTCPKPFAALAVMKPAWPVVRSLRSMRRPCAVSFMVTTMRSPEFMKRSVAPFGVKVPTVGLIGLAGSPSGRGEDCVSHIAIPNQNAGCSWKLKDCVAVGTPVGATGSVGRVRTYCMRFPLPG